MTHKLEQSLVRAGVGQAWCSRVYRRLGSVKPGARTCSLRVLFVEYLRRPADFSQSSNLDTRDGNSHKPRQRGRLAPEAAKTHTREVVSG